ADTPEKTMLIGRLAHRLTLLFSKLLDVLRKPRSSANTRSRSRLKTNMNLIMPILIPTRESCWMLLQQLSRAN
ncbi:MAG: hypothetical protein ACK56F_08000, partial [bacterium]